MEEKENLIPEEDKAEVLDAPAEEALKEKKYIPYEDDEDEEEDDYYSLPKNPFEGEEALAETTYTIHLDEYEKGFIAFQKKFAYPKNYVMTGIFLVIMVLYGEQLLRKPDDFFFRLFLFILCGVMIAGMWINLRSVRKKLMKSISQLKDDTYTASVFEKGIEIITHVENGEEEIPATCIKFSNEDFYILNREDMFILYLRKQMFYIIPKKNLSENEVKLFEDKFSEKLQKRYSVKIKAAETKEKA